MTQIGIGELKHAKARKTAAQTRRVFNARSHGSQQKDEAEAPKEGQLAVDILQTEDTMIIVCPIAGVEKPDIKVAIQDDVLTIRGKRKKPAELEHKQKLVSELYWGTFSRSIVLPDYIDRGKINARIHEHMLIISIPKTEDFKTRIIHVSEES